MIEVEKKYRLSAAEAAEVERSLAEVGAEQRGEDLEENLIYNGGALNGRHCVLRIRRTASRTLFTFKERIPGASDVKQQIEHEVEASDADELRSIVESLGFRLDIVYEKRRRTWWLDGAEIVLDELPFGLFMEVEGSLSDIRAAEARLGLERLTPEPLTYPALTAQYGVSFEDHIEARFS